MANDIQVLEAALKSADAAGDTQEATKIAKALQELYNLTEAKSVIADVASRAKVGPVRYIKDKMRQGPGDAVQTASLLGRFGVAAADPLNFVHQATTEPAQFFGGMLSGSNKDREGMDSVMGAENLAPDNSVTKALGAGAGALTDPTSYIGGAGLIRKGVTSVLPAMAGDFAGSVADKAGAGMMGQLGASLLGGGIGGATNATLGRGGRAVGAVAGLARNGQGMIDGANRKLLNQAEQHVQNTIRDAVAADPSLIDKITKLQQEAKLLGVPLPLHTLGENPVIKAAITTLARKDPTFAGLYLKQYDDALQTLGKDQNQVFGDPVTAAGRLQGAMQDTRDTQVQRINDKLDARAFTASKPIAPPYNAAKMSEALGKRFNIVDSPETISPKSRPLYETVDTLAEKHQDKLTGDSVKEIAKFLQIEKKESPFSKFPLLMETAGKALQKEPAKATNEVATRYGQVVLDQSPEAYKPLSYKQASDLKEAISSEYRRLNKNDGDYFSKRAELSKLRSLVDDSMAKDFNPETLEARKIADGQYAFDFTLRDMGNSVFKGGVIDPASMMKWLSDPQNQSAVAKLKDISGVSLKELSEKPSIAVAKIMEKKDSVNGIYSRLNQQQILDASKMTPDAIMQEIKRNPAFAGQFLQKYRKNGDALLALKSIALDDIMKSPEPLTELLKNQSTSQAYARVFGPGYRQHVEELASLSQRLATNPASVGFDFKNAINKDQLQEVSGVPLTQVFSKLRNPIMSNWQAIVELGSKAMTTKAEDAYEQQMKQILLDPVALAEYAKAIKPSGPVEKINPNKLLSWARKWGVGEAQKTSSQAARGAFLGLQDGVINSTKPEE